MTAKSMMPYVEGNSAIRAMFEEGNRLAEIYGKENVYDFSLGNPSVPAPEEVNQAIKDIVEEEDTLLLHGYNNSSTASIAWFEADSVVHEGPATLRIRDQSLFESSATHMVTILHGIAAHAAGRYL